MNKSLIKAYAMKIDEEKVNNFARNEGINLTEDESKLFVSTIKNNIDEIIDGDATKIIESIKDKVSTETYDKLLELFNKYKKFID